MKLEITEEERTIIVDMLKKAQAEIPIEIHHCRTNDFKTFLKDQLAKVEALLKKIG
ncbi:MAG TPA: hypothetical protein PKG60_05885 [Spirochaetota bacterium]|nr:hypothetical protein [Spirochaetota bacterium]HPS86530.1 hypothetical protein [Spirochaetota bacterium]